MIDVPVMNIEGKEVGKFQVDEALLGTTVRPALLKQALVRHHANQRQGTVKTKSRAEVEGSTKKLYAQKHTGNARRGNIRTPVMKGGGMAFAKAPRDFRQEMPVQQRRLARNNAILSKILSNTLVLLDGLKLPAAKTKEVAKVLAALKADRSVLIATEGLDQQLYRSARNIQKTLIKPAAEINAYDVLSKRTMIMTKAALEGVLKGAKPSKVKTADTAEAKG
ncbi:MAG TPA: 50S ribosomal protein L4 [Phycisphaerae bacterium]|nr:50S ribosomal protein L4 [Phycisphaerae bacterium]